jgi:hypothetical protein
MKEVKEMEIPPNPIHSIFVVLKRLELKEHQGIEGAFHCEVYHFIDKYVIEFEGYTFAIPK